ncbi:MAG: hypothetical protein DWQ06_04580 [Calditrichaeota bacterium]|nr:MAG: hypothetical protein DWQ06_04580 [Calditrichota bacterium]
MASISFSEEAEISLSNLTTVQDSLFGTIFQGSFNLPTDLDSLAEVKFAEVQLSSNLVFADSSELLITEFIPLNADGTANESYSSTEVQSLVRNGNVFFDITKLIVDWKDGILGNNGFVVRKKHPNSTDPSPSFINLPDGNIAKVKVVYFK